MMITLPEILLLKFPDLHLINDVTLVSINGEIVLQDWRYEGAPPPTAQELEQWQTDPDIEIAWQHKQNSFLNKDIIASLNELDVKSIRALRTNDIDRLTSLEEQAVALRGQLLPEA